MTARTNPRHFDEVVSNAIEFLDRSVVEMLKGNLRFSAVFFYQAVELFVKARLLHEHWSLVVSDPGKADLAAFEKGDFHSVTLKQAATRLRSIAGDDITTAQRAFEPIRKRRNRVIHFHAAELAGQPSTGMIPSSEQGSELFEKTPDEIIEIVMEQCVAWFELHALLTQRWRQYFDDSRGKIEWLDSRMRELRPYLTARFDRLKPEIEKLKAQGKKITECSACGFMGNQDTEIFPGMTRSRCLVCRREDRAYRFPCPCDDCEGKIVVSDGGCGNCTDCEKYISIDEIISRLEPSVHPGDPEDRSRAFCSDCQSYEAMGGTVVFLEDADRYICFNCLQDFGAREVSSCEWCGELVTGESEDSFLMGCMNCEGRMGHGIDD